MRLPAATIVLCLAVPATARIPAPAQDCATPALPPELAAWPNRTPLTAATTAPAATRATLAIGRSAELRLLPTPTIRYALRPEKPGAPSTYGGLAGFTVARPGTYRVALGSALWIDVLRNGRAVASAIHIHGPPCTGVRKIVDFRLEPGRHLLQLSGGKEPSVTAMIAAAD